MQIFISQNDREWGNVKIDMNMGWMLAKEKEAIESAGIGNIQLVLLSWLLREKRYSSRLQI